MLALPNQIAASQRIQGKTTVANSPCVFTAAVIELTRCENATGANASTEVASSAQPAIAAMRLGKCAETRNQMKAKGVLGTRFSDRTSSSGSVALTMVSAVRRDTTLFPAKKGARRIGA